MRTVITRRQATLLLAESLIAAPIVAGATGVGRSNPSLPVTDKPHAAGGQHGAPVYIVLWFDTEDYILPASDDAAKRLAKFLSRQGIRATFKIVGEKARVLEQRNRTDVIAALTRQEIGYHSNTHSQQPTVAEYESVLDWELGQQEFTRRERPGFDDVTRIFGRPPSCYGQPGVSWAPQAYPALKKWGVQVYLDDGDHVQLEGKPFWYGGLLNIFHIMAGRELEPNSDWSNLDTVKGDFKALHDQLSSQPEGGVVSFMFHPTQFVTEEFWDKVNFALGANPARSAWKLPPEKSPADSERAFQYFEDLVSYIKSFPGVRFVTASEACVLHRDKARGRSFGARDVAEIAGRVNADVTYQVHDDYALAASEVFSLLNSFTVMFVNQNVAGTVKLGDTPYGPASSAHGAAVIEGSMDIGWNQFSRTSIEVGDFLEKYGAIPNVVWLGSTAVTPETYLLALAHVALWLVSKGRAPDFVKLLPAELAAGKWVAQDTESIWNWPIFPSGFHSAHLMELARLQAWTIKPAILEGVL